MNNLRPGLSEISWYFTDNNLLFSCGILTATILPSITSRVVVAFLSLARMTNLFPSNTASDCTDKRERPSGKCRWEHAKSIVVSLVIKNGNNFPALTGATANLYSTCLLDWCFFYERTGNFESILNNFVISQFYIIDMFIDSYSYEFFTYRCFPISPPEILLNISCHFLVSDRCWLVWNAKVTFYSGFSGISYSLDIS